MPTRSPRRPQYGSRVMEKFSRWWLLMPVDPQGIVTDPRLPMALLDMLQSLARALAAPQATAAPSWQAYSSVYPVIVPRPANPSVHTWRPPS